LYAAIEAVIPRITVIRSSGVQEFRSSGVQEFRSSGVQEFRLVRSRKLQQESASCD
jgi:hypothetical protein